jgi:hypothetical protein
LTDSRMNMDDAIFTADVRSRHSGSIKSAFMFLGLFS